MHETSAAGTPRRHSVPAGLALAAFGLLLAGCGSELYDQRLGNTKLLFAHMDLLNQNLQGDWADATVGVKLRVPLQFAMLPPPAMPDPAAKKGPKPAAEEGMEEEEEEEEEIIDDRQPQYINIELPGLRGAFQAKVKVLGANNKLEDGEAFLYVMTNHDEAEDPERADKFESSFVSTLSEAVRESVNPEDWHDEKVPARPGSFVRPITFKTVTISPSEEIAGLARQFTLYSYMQGDIRVLIMFVLPRDIDAGEKMTVRIPLCLETLEVNGNKLFRPASTTAPVGAPAATF